MHCEFCNHSIVEGETIVRILRGRMVASTSDPTSAYAHPVESTSEFYHTLCFQDSVEREVELRYLPEVDPEWTGFDCAVCGESVQLGELVYTIQEMDICNQRLHVVPIGTVNAEEVRVLYVHTMCLDAEAEQVAASVF